ncbi:MAG: DUF4255 domain-containing protein [Spirirestis rafaelensis WJT71-NPBG6]|jgi:hypothetical protein|nr:DUF4255 domain-containing protein [Spirirestis rafaelensis WJT71-NPBG6]
MSNALSIAAVTAVLKDLLENGLVKDAIATSLGDVIVTALPPDRVSQGTDERAQINLFLYQVTQNRNPDWMSGEFRSKQQRPPLALDLHYLLTAYGAKDFQAELLLGYAMQLLHEMPVLTRDIIETSLKNAATVNTSSVLSQALAAVSVFDLAAHIGQIKICPEFFNMEETSKLWSSLQTHYRPSAGYQASMVLINSRNLKSSAEVTPFSEPIIEQVTTPTEADNMIVAGSTLILRGKQLRGDITRIRLGGMEKLIEVQVVQETQMSVTLPPNLYAGVQSVQVIHLKMGTPAMPHYEVASNVAAFVLHPIISATVSQVQENSSDLRSLEITVKFNPKVGKAQRVVLLLNQVTTDKGQAYHFFSSPRTEDTDSITIPVKNIQTGTYFVRVQVDGAQSPLYKNQAGEYDSPQVKIP